MQIDVLGPANAPNAVTNRPGDTRVFGVFDTWFQDCTSFLLNNGTKLLASWLNGILGQFRNVIRANGATASGTDIVALDNGDDALVLKSVQHLMQRRLQGYSVAAGTANALTAALSPALAEYKAGTPIRLKISTTNTGAATLDVNGLGPKPIRRPDGAILNARDMIAGGVVEVVYDGAAFQLVAAPTKALTTNAVYYVNGTTGSDSNDGLAAAVADGHGPFKTIQKALDTCRLFNLNGYNVTINIAAGTYNESLTLYAVNGSGQISLIGNTANPASVAVVGQSIAAVSVGPGGYGLSGLKISNPSGYAIIASGSGNQIFVSEMEWGACLYDHINVTSFAFVNVSGNHRITGNARAHIYCDQLAAIGSSGLTVSLVIPALVSFSAAFICLSRQAAASIVYAISGAGNVAGQRYSLSLGALASTNGGGANYYPGNAAGYADASSMYA